MMVTMLQSRADDPELEARRLAALRKYDILDTPPDGCFDRVTAVAAKLFRTPIAIVSLVDEDRIWFKSHHGLEVEQISRDPGLCASAILEGTPYIVEDAKKDVRALANPLVAGEFGLRFYVGAPLRTRDGYNLGTLCVIDHEPRTVSPEEVEQLEHLAAIVMEQMELRLQARRAVAEVTEVTRRSAELSRYREEEARQASALLSAIGASSPNPIYAKDLDLRFIYANEEMLAVLGRSADEVLGSTIDEIIPRPEQAVAYAEANRRVLDSGSAEHVEEVFTRPDGSDVIFHSSMAPLRLGQASIVGLVGVSVDVTDRKRAEQHQRLLINELNHRVKNTLALVQGIAHQSFKDGGTPEAKSAFEGRLEALSATHSLLTSENWESVSLRKIVGDAIEPFKVRSDCFNVSGPNVALPPKSAVTLALAVHELGTNAAKYGALSDDSGRVLLHWSTAGDRLRLTWREEGGPPVRAPTRRGFGSRLIERGLAAELKGKVVVEFEETGLICSVDAPLPAAGPSN
jgi:PAS domain S-box-containing protein